MIEIAINKENYKVLDGLGIVKASFENGIFLESFFEYESRIINTNVYELVKTVNDNESISWSRGNNINSMFADYTNLVVDPTRTPMAVSPQHYDNIFEAINKWMINSVVGFILTRKDDKGESVFNNNQIIVL